MRITLVYSASQRAEVHVMRQLDGRRRRLVLAVGWRMTPTEILADALKQLTAEEFAELAGALGLAAWPEVGR
jgi:formylmethanofuran dehydrogenase subunit B